MYLSILCPFSYSIGANGRSHVRFLRLKIFPVYNNFLIIEQCLHNNHPCIFSLVTNFHKKTLQSIATTIGELQETQGTTELLLEASQERPQNPGLWKTQMTLK